MNSKRMAVLLGLTVMTCVGVLWHYQTASPPPPPAPRSTATNGNGAEQATHASAIRGRPAAPPGDGGRTSNGPPSFPGITVAVNKVNSLDDWLALYPEQQAASIRAFSRKYAGVYQVRSPEQIQWMQRHGYVLPDDLVAAAGMSDEALRQLSDQGNDKATMLLYDRLVDEYITQRDAFIAAGGAREDLNTGAGHSRVLDIMALDVQMLKNNSPFRFFLKTRDQEMSQTVDAVAYQNQKLGALEAAGILGDSRIDVLIDQCRAEGACDPAAVAVAAAVASDIFDAISNPHWFGCKSGADHSMPMPQR